MKIAEEDVAVKVRDDKVEHHSSVNNVTLWGNHSQVMLHYKLATQHNKQIKKVLKKHPKSYFKRQNV